MTKPSLFIGSSSEGLEFARAARSLLAQDAEITLWNEGFFSLGSTFIETLINALPRFDFAVLVLTADDLVNSRAVESFGPRDNVIFELGLFMGRLGRSRTFILHQSNAALKIPTDLSGVTTATYGWPREDRNYRAAVGVACDSIREVIRDLGVAEAKTAKQLEHLEEKAGALERTTHQDIGIQLASLRADMEELRAKLAEALAAPRTPSVHFTGDEKAFETAVAEYRMYSKLGEWRSRVEVDKRLASGAGRLPVHVIEKWLRRYPTDPEVSMAAAVCLGLPFPGDNDEEAARLLANLLASPFERVRYRAAKSIDLRGQRSDTSLAARSILKDALTFALQTEAASIVREALLGAESSL
jgi:hypothetical protein